MKYSCLSHKKNHTAAARQCFLEKRVFLFKRSYAQYTTRNNYTFRSMPSRIYIVFLQVVDPRRQNLFSPKFCTALQCQKYYIRISLCAQLRSWRSKANNKFEKSNKLDLSACGYYEILLRQKTWKKLSIWSETAKRVGQRYQRNTDSYFFRILQRKVWCQLKSYHD